MRIALVHDWLTGMRGGEKCLEVLCRRFPGADLYTLLHVPGAASPAIERMRIKTSFLQRFPGIGRHYRWYLPLMPAAVDRWQIAGDVDLVVSLSHAVAKSVRVPAGVPHVCYCFTPMRYAWHLRGDYFDKPMDDGQTARLFAGRLSLRPDVLARDAVLNRIRDWDRSTNDRVTHFVAISRTVQARIRECYGRDSRVIYPPVDTQFYTPADVRREGFYLCVSALVPYKRLDLAVAACNRLRKNLLIIGKGPEAQRLAQQAGPTVKLLGWQPDEVIRDYLRRCRAFLFPGHEDFGIAPVEAQACGAPVIAFGQGGAAETVISADSGRHGTGLLFPQQTVDGLCDAIGRFEQGVRFCPTMSRSQAERFSAARYEHELIDYLKQVASTREARLL